MFFLFFSLFIYLFIYFILCQKSAITEFWCDYFILFIQGTRYLQMLWICKYPFSQIIANNIPTKYYPNDSICVWGMPRKSSASKIWLRRNNSKINKMRESYHSCTLHAYSTWLTSLPSIIKISQRALKLWSEQGYVYWRTDGRMSCWSRYISQTYSVLG